MRITLHLSIGLYILYSTTWASHIPLGDEFDVDARAVSIHKHFIANRRSAIADIVCPFQAPPKARVMVERPDPWKTFGHKWRRGITATVFWIGEESSERNPTPNKTSAWDPNWQSNFGGVDHPGKRKGYRPATFTPKLNPFYIALPYNDIAPSGVHRTEAPDVIPWYWRAHTGSSQTSVCKGRWVAIHYRGKICYAQWEDCGPFNIDDWEYVFTGKSPKPNPNGNAGIEISPSVRDYLAIRSGYRVSWKFIEDHEVPPGPWINWQTNNSN